MTHLSKKQIEQLQHNLLEQRKDITHRLEENDHYGISDTTRQNTGELSTLDNHPADLGTEVFERGKDLALAEHDELHLQRIEGALERIQDGTYGICETCRRPIKLDRLQALPETAYCKEHSPQTFVASNRPIEEMNMYPAFGRTSRDERDDFNGFDGEDTWQIVESYGSSNSPAMAEDSNVDSYNDMEIEASDELDGFCEPFESYVATDIYGKNVFFFRNDVYRKHMDNVKHLAVEDSLGTGSNTY
ncbi:YteA family regulatory protein [Paenibacillus shirakamiensis]|uniref:YteA family regulatory protein n=1 Tax=Paenibacillus shirakamiensis TaxID=1265935 RepID=A0ABS4JBZ1_9BACL|nr:TraR/DksA C4-type zinc finger protein [Paenibacillus shirakamiensis]MBP1999242.1 YteA family regulatory protein [Paenibacillus shirakamiensis]